MGIQPGFEVNNIYETHEQRYCGELACHQPPVETDAQHPAAGRSGTVRCGGHLADVDGGRVCAGIKHVSVADDAEVAPEDVGAHLFLREEHAGKSTRADATLPGLRELNAIDNTGIVVAKEEGLLTEDGCSPHHTAPSTFCAQSALAHAVWASSGVSSMLAAEHRPPPPVAQVLIDS